MGRHDFPARWQGLLPELIAKLKPPSNPETVYGVLETANAVFKRYRNQFLTPQLGEELAYSQQFVVPLLDIMATLVAQITAPQGCADADVLRRCVLSARLACRTFYSLNSPGLTQVPFPCGSNLPTCAACCMGYRPSCRACSGRQTAQRPSMVQCCAKSSINGAIMRKQHAHDPWGCAAAQLAGMPAGFGPLL